MSSNNLLFIEKVDGKFYVSDVDADVGGGYRLRDEGFATLKEAHQYARSYERPVEYGIEIAPNCFD